MLREHIIGFLEATVIFLLMTNAVSIILASHAMRVAKAVACKDEDAESGLARKANVLLHRAAWPLP
jgi:hypothetical protein